MITVTIGVGIGRLFSGIGIGFVIALAVGQWLHRRDIRAAYRRIGLLVDEATAEVDRERRAKR